MDDEIVDFWVCAPGQSSQVGYLDISLELVVFHVAEKFSREQHVPLLPLAETVALHHVDGEYNLLVFI